jgi:hypothetical protein
VPFKSALQINKWPFKKTLTLLSYRGILIAVVANKRQCEIKKVIDFINLVYYDWKVALEANDL